MNVADHVAHNQESILTLTRVIVVLLVAVLATFIAVLVLLALAVREHLKISALLRVSQGYAELTEASKDQSRTALLDKIDARVTQAVTDAAVSHPAEVKVIVPPVILDPASGKYKIPEPATGTHPILPPTVRPGVILGAVAHLLVVGGLLGVVVFVSHFTSKADAMDGYQGHYNAAFKALNERKPAEAAESWKRARAAGGSDAECLRHQADAAFHARDLAGAESAAKELLTLVPRHFHGHYILGLVAETRKDKVSAVRHYTRAGQYAMTEDDRTMAVHRLSRVQK